MEWRLTAVSEARLWESHLRRVTTTKKTGARSNLGKSLRGYGVGSANAHAQREVAALHAGSRAMGTSGGTHPMPE